MQRVRCRDSSVTLILYFPTRSIARIVMNGTVLPAADIFVRYVDARRPNKRAPAYVSARTMNEVSTMVGTLASGLSPP